MKSYWNSYKKVERQRHTGRRWCVTMEVEIGMIHLSLSQGTTTIVSKYQKLEEAGFGGSMVLLTP